MVERFLSRDKPHKQCKEKSWASLGTPQLFSPKLEARGTVVAFFYREMSALVDIFHETEIDEMYVVDKN